jgi:hypothetical protein
MGIALTIRRWLCACSVGAQAVGGFAMNAHAVVLEFDATYQIAIGDFPAFTAMGSGIAEVGTASTPAEFGFPAGVFAFATTRTVALPFGLDKLLSLTGINRVGAFEAVGDAFVGTLGLEGGLRYEAPFKSTTVPPNPRLTWTIDPGVIGVGGAVTAMDTAITNSVSPVPVTFTVELGGAAFQVATDMRTAGGLGTIQLQAPISFGSNIPEEGLATLAITFVPEPGGAALAALAAIASLAALGVRRLAIERK